jgi:hypothetical protein
MYVEEMLSLPTSNQRNSMRSDFDEILDDFNKVVFDGFLSCVNGCGWAWLITQNILASCFCPPLEIIRPARDIEEGVELDTWYETSPPPHFYRQQEKIIRHRIAANQDREKEEEKETVQADRDIDSPVEKCQDTNSSGVVTPATSGTEDYIRDGYESDEPRSECTQSSDSDDSFVLLPESEKGDYGDSSHQLP